MLQTIDYTFREKIKSLEEDVKYLRRKCRKLEDRMTKLEDEKKGAKVDMSPVTTKDDKKTASKDKNVPQDDKMPTNVKSVEQVEETIAGVVGDQNRFKHLCLQLFMAEELVSMTRTGKRTIKCVGIVKPQLDQIRFSKLETLVMRHTSYDKNTFQNVLENLQKVLRRDQKETN